MSAWIVSKEHIDYIVSAQKFNQYGRFTVYHDGERHEMKDDAWGQILWAENVRSVQFRYPKSGPTDLPGPIDFDPRRNIKWYRFEERVDATRIGAYKAMSSLEYQSCEHPEWQASLARAYCHELRDICITSMPEYDAVNTWSI